MNQKGVFEINYRLRGSLNDISLDLIRNHVKIIEFIIELDETQTLNRISRFYDPTMHSLNSIVDRVDTLIDWISNLNLSKELRLRKA